MISGWRRATPSLDQLHQAVFHLRAVHPDLRVAVVADPALKHSLPPGEQPLTAKDVNLREMAGEDAKAPWHFKVLVGLVVLYLGWRLVQLVGLAF